MDTMQRQLRALFFDFDGVIVDSLHTKTEAFRSLFKDYPDDVIEKVLAYHKQHGGISRVEKIALAHEQYIGVSLGDEELKKWSVRYSDLVVEKVINIAWIKGAVEFLKTTVDLGINIFIISGTPEIELKYIIDRRGMAGYFDECLGSPVRKPVHIRKLLEQYGLKESECVFIGDALTDYDAAEETGLHFVGIQGEVAFPKGTLVLDDCTNLQQALDHIFESRPLRS
ncbi:MAG: phosphoglycolate phosphatase-like HAD superfamily hydrolase [Desulforhopalus sp.]|jgi:phosphoglycolate phosphatase-like HAD superfamily hydrolase